jgi:hypothetical protein
MQLKTVKIEKPDNANFILGREKNASKGLDFPKWDEADPTYSVEAAKRGG